MHPQRCCPCAAAQSDGDGGKSRWTRLSAAAAFRNWARAGETCCDSSHRLGPRCRPRCSTHGCRSRQTQLQLQHRLPRCSRAPKPDAAKVPKGNEMLFYYRKWSFLECFHQLSWITRHILWFLQVPAEVYFCLLSQPWNWDCKLFWPGINCLCCPLGLSWGF